MDRDDMLRIFAPAIAAGAVWFASKSLRTAYSATTGAPPPKADDLDEPFGKVIVFAMATAVATAVINVAIQRSVAKASHRRELQATTA